MKTETLVGQWLVQDGKAVADDVCKEIDRLINTHFEKIAGGGWETLFRDRRDGGFWELTYPMSYMHGGGPPRLDRVSPEDAETRYGVPPA